MMAFIYLYKNEPLLLSRATHCHLHVKPVTQLFHTALQAEQGVSVQKRAARSLPESGLCKSQGTTLVTVGRT